MCSNPRCQKFNLENRVAGTLEEQVQNQLWDPLAEEGFGLAIDVV